MKKLKLILLFTLLPMFLFAQGGESYGKKTLWDLLTSSSITTYSGVHVLPYANNLYNLGASGTIWNYGYFDTTITNHLANTTWTLNSVAVTSTGTQLNYLAGATGTTGTTTTNLVFSTSPTFVTPTLGAAIGTSLALGGATLGTNAFAVTGISLFNNPILASDGAISAPAYSFASSTNTGMYYASNYLYVGINGVKYMDLTLGELQIYPYSDGNAGLVIRGTNASYLALGESNRTRFEKFADDITGVNRTTNPQDFRVYSRNGDGTNDRWTSNKWGTGADSLKFSIAQTYNGGSAQGSFNATGFSSYLLDNNITLGAGTATIDYTITVNGEDNDGIITYMEDEDRFDFDNHVKVGGDLTVTGNLIVSGTETCYGEMYFNDNSTAQTPTANDTLGILYMTQGDLNGFTFDAGSVGAYTEVADGGGGTIAILDVAHGLSVGDWIMISGSSVAGYEGVHVVTYSVTDTFKVEVTYSATATGNWQEPSRLTLTKAGLTSAKFMVNWNISGSVAGTPAGDIVVWGCYVNELPKVESMQIRTLSTGSVYGSFGSGAILNMSTNDDLFMFFISDDVNALTHKYGSVRVSKL